jgi:hypothetical protein
MAPCVWARWRTPFREEVGWFFRLLFLAVAESRGVEPVGQLARLARSMDGLDEVCQGAAERYHSPLFVKPSPPMNEAGTRRVLEEMAAWLAQGPVAPADLLTTAYEAVLVDVPERKRSGAYYTPPPLADAVLKQVLPSEPGLTPPLILDPACGAGVFLHRAFVALQPHFAGDDILQALHGVDLDPLAIEIARLGLLTRVAEGRGTDGDFPDLSANLRCANALPGPIPVAECSRSGEPSRAKGRAPGSWSSVVIPGCRSARGTYPGEPIDWPHAFPAVFQHGGFDIVVGNPPWGQKDVTAAPAWKTYLRQQFPSSAGIFDLFRPFVELSVRLTAPGGAVGLVLPDIVLLKNYAPTRRFLLDSLTLQHIGWWGQAFAGAQIDVATIVGRKGPAPIEHQVQVSLHQGTDHREHTIAQADFFAQPRHVFNLHLTAGRLAIFRRLAELPRLGDWFEVHEGVHSGNMRAALFVDRSLDDSCRELYLGRGEIRPYQMNWHGRYLHLAPLSGKTGQQYAHPGRREWHEREKVLVRRTGDRLLAAVDRSGRYASNNFFLLFPRRQGVLNLDGLCAFLNGRLATWYFRAIEPRQGRAFAELKIKHLTAFPLPTTDDAGTARLNALGADRATAAESDHAGLDAAIDDLVEELLGVRENLAAD